MSSANSDRMERVQIDKTLLKEAKAKKLEKEREELAKLEAERYLGLQGQEETPWSRFGKDVVYWACEFSKKERPKRTDLFVPGRMTFSFNLGFRGEGDELEYVGSDDAPIPVLTSRAEVRGYQKHFQAARDDALLLDIGKQLLFSKLRSKNKVVKKTELVVEQTQEEEDDIFADVGRDYELIVSQRDSEPAKTTVKTDYFGQEIVNGKIVDVAKAEEAMRAQVSDELKRAMEIVKEKPLEQGVKRAQGIFDDVDDGFSDEDFSEEEAKVKTVLPAAKKARTGDDKAPKSDMKTNDKKQGEKQTKNRKERRQDKNK
jgi:hypothetical protein